jgi:hypothetical protein
MRRSFLAGFAALGVLAASSAALAWGQAAEIEVNVHGHTFHKVAVESRDCVLSYKLWFNAPADVYSSKATARNVYLFRSRIDFQNGKAASVPVFANRGAGQRLYENSFDTASQGCWARETQKLSRLRVEACRGDGCTPDPVK